jgi:drug/metabolite transporter (DMT)-like permease
MAKRAGLFDLRGVLALLFAVYGVVLTVMGLFATSEEDLRKSGDINVNLWMGVAMLVTAALFGLWQRLRPLAVPEEAPDGTHEETPADTDR